MGSSTPTPTNLTASLLSSALNVPITSLSTFSACAEGDNMAGNVVRVKATDKDGKDHCLIYKGFPPSFEGAEWILALKIFRIEHYTYKTIIPRLIEFASSKGLSWSPPIPKYIGGFNDDKTDWLLLEDCGPSGFTMASKWRSLDKNEVSLILTEVAKLHAISYAFLQQKENQNIFEDDPDFNLLLNLEHLVKSDDFDPVFQTAFEAMSEVAKEELPHLKEKIEKIYPKAYKIMKESIKNPIYFQTILHSDLWTNNVLFKYNDDGNDATHVKFIDFQMTRRGYIFHELGYTIFTSTTPDFRKDNLLPLLNEYYDTFQQSLDKLGTPTPPGFTKDFFLQQFQTECHLATLIQMGFSVPRQLGAMVEVQQEWKSKGEPIDPLWTKEGLIEITRRSDKAVERVIALFKEADELGLI